MKNLSILCVAAVFFASFAPEKKKEVSEWRGENRSGTYNGTNLLKEWPEAGPNLLWDYEGIGNGYGSPVVTASTVYVNGEIDSLAYLFALDRQGKFLWKTEFGRDWMKNYIGSRSAPTVVDDLVYVASGMGDVACVRAKTGELVWKLNMLEKFQGRNIRFGYSQSLLVNDGLVYCAPGGEENNVVALNRFTGETAWTSKGVGEISAYCSPLLLDFPSRKVLVTFSDDALMGFESNTGELLWTHLQDSACDINGNTPIFDNGFLYYVTGCGNGTVKLEVSEDGGQIAEVWRNKDMDNIMGGAVKLGDRIIASGHRKKKWKSIDANSGELVDSLNFGRGATIAADNMLYCYNEQGQVGLVKTENGKMELVSKFKITKGTNEHFAQPVIRDGILYIRHGNALMAYGIKEKPTGD